MSIWETKTIDETPEISLKDWTIYEGYSNFWEGPSRHFVGYNITENEGRVSSEIVMIDKENKIGKTKSGRTYKLVGRPGYSSDGSYVLGFFVHRNEMHSVKDVTSEVFPSN